LFEIYSFGAHKPQTAKEESSRKDPPASSPNRIPWGSSIVGKVIVAPGANESQCPWIEIKKDNGREHKSKLALDANTAQIHVKI